MPAPKTVLERNKPNDSKFERMLVHPKAYELMMEDGVMTVQTAKKIKRRKMKRVRRRKKRPTYYKQLVRDHREPEMKIHAAMESWCIPYWENIVHIRKDPNPQMDSRRIMWTRSGKPKAEMKREFGPGITGHSLCTTTWCLGETPEKFREYVLSKLAIIANEYKCRLSWDLYGALFMFTFHWGEPFRGIRRQSQIRKDYMPVVAQEWDTAVTYTNSGVYTHLARAVCWFPGLCEFGVLENTIPAVSAAVTYGAAVHGMVEAAVSVVPDYLEKYILNGR